MKCVISGMETNNKWKGTPIAKEFMEAAKELRADRKFLTIRESLQEVQKQFNRDFVKYQADKIKAKNAEGKSSVELTKQGIDMVWAQVIQSFQLPNTIKLNREKREMSLDALAKISGISEETLTEMEAGELAISTENAIEIMKAMSITYESISDIVTKTKEIEAKKEEDRIAEEALMIKTPAEVDENIPQQG